MTPKVAKLGRSFKGAAAYYLHDKNAQTSERVGFTETVNINTTDPRIAIAQMIDVAENAEQLKQAAGVKSRGKAEKPVYTYSLAWKPGQEPTKAEQIEAARETLQALGIADRQALIVAHTDTDHPHVHVIVNLVSLENGKVATLGRDHNTLSRWAQAYEERTGQIVCPRRVENNAARDRGEYVKDRSPDRREHVAWQKQRTAELWNQFRVDRQHARDDRKPQYDALWQQKEERFATRRAEVKQLYKPIWRDVFKRQREELKRYDSSLTARIGYALNQDKESRPRAILKAFRADQSQRRDFIEAQTIERKQISKHQEQTIFDAGREITKAWKYDRDQLKAAHQAQDDERHAATKKASDAIWRDKRPREEMDKVNDRRSGSEQPDKSRLRSDLDEAADRRRSPRRERAGDRPRRSRHRPSRRERGQDQDF